MMQLTFRNTPHAISFSHHKEEEEKIYVHESRCHNDENDRCMLYF